MESDIPHLLSLHGQRRRRRLQVSGSSPFPAPHLLTGRQLLPYSLLAERQAGSDRARFGCGITGNDKSRH
jgi:hypothetical protein